MQGSRPTHPALLDWLAVDFMESGWNIKRLNKMIVMSATYRQSSVASDDLLEKDPDNQLLERGPRMRMSAEQIRDNALAVSGLLVRTIGGPSTYPYQPEGIWVPGTTPYRYPKPEEISPDDQHRRSLYTFVKRNSPPPSMSVFDFSERHHYHCPASNLEYAPAGSGAAGRSAISRSLPCARNARIERKGG